MPNYYPWWRQNPPGSFPRTSGAQAAGFQGPGPSPPAPPGVGGWPGMPPVPPWEDDFFNPPVTNPNRTPDTPNISGVWDPVRWNITHGPGVGNIPFNYDNPIYPSPTRMPGLPGNLSTITDPYTGNPRLNIPGAYTPNIYPGLPDDETGPAPYPGSVAPLSNVAPIPTEFSPGPVMSMPFRPEDRQLGSMPMGFQDTLPPPAYMGPETTTAPYDQRFEGGPYPSPPSTIAYGGYDPGIDYGYTENQYFPGGQNFIGLPPTVPLIGEGGYNPAPNENIGPTAAQYYYDYQTPPDTGVGPGAVWNAGQPVNPFDAVLNQTTAPFTTPSMMGQDFWGGSTGAGTEAVNPNLFTPEWDFSGSGQDNIPTAPGVEPDVLPADYPGINTSDLVHALAQDQQDNRLLNQLRLPTDWAHAGQLFKDAAGNIVDATGKVVAAAGAAAQSVINNIMNNPGYSSPDYLRSIGYQPGQGRGSLFPGGPGSFGDTATGGESPGDFYRVANGPNIIPFTGGVGGAGGSFFTSSGQGLPAFMPANVGGGGPINASQFMSARHWANQMMKGIYGVPGTANQGPGHYYPNYWSEHPQTIANYVQQVGGPEFIPGPPINMGGLSPQQYWTNVFRSRGYVFPPSSGGSPDVGGGLPGQLGSAGGSHHVPPRSIS